MVESVTNPKCKDLGIYELLKCQIINVYSAEKLLTIIKIKKLLTN